MRFWDQNNSVYIAEKEKELKFVLIFGLWCGMISSTLHQLQKYDIYRVITDLYIKMF